MTAADEALLTAKRIGKNRIQLAGQTDQKQCELPAEPQQE